MQAPRAERKLLQRSPISALLSTFGSHRMVVAEMHPSRRSIRQPGPLRYAEGPHDHEGKGRERYWDMTPEQRKAAWSGIIRGTGSWQREEDRQFSKGWLDEQDRHRRNWPDEP